MIFTCHIITKSFSKLPVIILRDTDVFLKLKNLAIHIMSSCWRGTNKKDMPNYIGKMCGNRKIIKKRNSNKNKTKYGGDKNYQGQRKLAKRAIRIRVEIMRGCVQ